MNYQLRECRECGYKVVEGAKTCRKCGASKPTISKELYSKYRNLQIRKLDDEEWVDDDEEWVDDVPTYVLVITFIAFCLSNWGLWVCGGLFADMLTWVYKIGETSWRVWFVGQTFTAIIAFIFLLIIWAVFLASEDEGNGDVVIGGVAAAIALQFFISGPATLICYYLGAY